LGQTDFKRAFAEDLSAAQTMNNSGAKIQKFYNHAD